MHQDEGQRGPKPADLDEVEVHNVCFAGEVAECWGRLGSIQIRCHPWCQRRGVAGRGRRGGDNGEERPEYENDGIEEKDVR